MANPLARNGRGIAMAAVIVALACFGEACSQIREAFQPAQSDAQQQRERDAQRPDVHPPLSPAPRRSRASRTAAAAPTASIPSASRGRAATVIGAPVVRNAPAAESLPPLDISVSSSDSLEPVDISIGRSARGPKSSTVTTVTSAPVFVTPSSHQAPLLRAARGTSFRVVGSEGDWYRVEWNDHGLGRRQGYLDRKDATLPDSPLTPVDPVTQTPRDGWRHADVLLKTAR